MSDSETKNRRRPRRKQSESSEEESGDEAPAPAPAAGVAKDRSGMGKVFAAFDELKRKKLQKAVVEGMFALAEKKYGKKRPVHEKADKQDAMADFELYLRSIRAKVKTAEDKLNAIMKQKKDMDAKVAAAEKEHADKKKVVDDAEKEKDAAEKESRDPVLPKDFIIPKKLGASKAGLGALVMKASAGAWEDKFAAMRSKKQSGGKNPAWTQKKDKTSALLGVGTKKRDRSAKGTADFGAALKPKKEGRRVNMMSEHYILRGEWSRYYCAQNAMNALVWTTRGQIKHLI